MTDKEKIDSEFRMAWLALAETLGRLEAAVMACQKETPLSGQGGGRGRRGGRR